MADTPNHAEREHAPFSPSASDRWLACPASVHLTETLAARGELPPRADTEHTTAGTVCHEVGEEYLRNWKDPEVGITYARAKEYTDHRGKLCVKVVPAEDLKRHVAPYVATVRSYFEDEKALSDQAILLVEEKVAIHGPAVFGTIDAAVIVPHQVIHVFDLKAGSGHIVGADAPQFLTYLCGLAEKYGSKTTRPGMAFFAHVCQAADDEEPHKSKHYTWEALQAHMKRIKQVVKEAPTAAPGPVGAHCVWCPVQDRCPAKNAQALAILDDDPEDGVVSVPDPAGLTVEQRAKIANLAPQIRKFLDAVEGGIVADLLRGAEVPGFKVVAGRSQRKWNPELDEEDLASELELYGVDPWERKLTSFTKVEKALKGLGSDVVDRLVVRGEGKPTLVPESDKRKAITGSVEVLDDDE